MRQHLAGTEIFIPSIAVGELYYGAYKSSKTTSNAQQIRGLLSITVVLNCSPTTADLYGQIKHKLETKGCPIPENDIWIAALALEYSLILVTRDEHFRQVDQLALEK
ncbi:MAG TPA: PIN domain-containing protein [Aggregatilineaceae bacterium]|nr:PIN domain-containing protein [Aggregatilineaceae bacterium]